MKNLILAVAIFVANQTFTQTNQLGVAPGSPLSISADPCTTGCVTLPAKLSISQAGASTEGTVTPNDQTFGGNKTFNGDVTVASNKRLFLWNGGDDDNPSLSFTGSTNTGIFLTTSASDTRINYTISGNKRMHLSKDGSLSISNNTDFNNQLDLNISHDATLDVNPDGTPDPQDGGVNVTTYGGTTTPLHTGTFTGRTASGSQSIPGQTKKHQAMAEFSGKGFYSTSGNPTDFEPKNKGVFGIYAAADHTHLNTGTYCGIKTTRLNTIPNDANHMSLMIDHAGNAGLTYLETGEFGAKTPNGWSAEADDSRFFSVESRTLTADVAYLLQNSDGTSGANLWHDYSANTVYLDNLRNDASAAFKIRLKTTSAVPITALTISEAGTAVRAGATTSTAKVGGTIDVRTTTLGNTAGTETVLYSKSIPGNMLFNIGDRIEFYASGTFTSSSSTNKTVRVEYNMVEIFTSNPLAITTTDYWSLHGVISRLTSTHVKCTVDFITSNAVLRATTKYTSVGATYTSPATLEVTGNGAFANDVVFQMGSTEWKPVQ